MAYVNGKTVQWYDPIRRRRRTKTYSTETQALAEAEKRDIEREHIQKGLIDGELVEQTEARHARIEGLSELHAQRLAKRGGTTAYRTGVARAIKLVTERSNIYDVSDLTHERLDKYFNSLKLDEGLSNRTHNFYLSTMRTFCKWLVRRNYLEKDPTEGIELLDPQKDRRRPSRALTLAEMDCLIESAGPRRFLYLLRFRTGLRSTECKRLRWSDFDLDDGVLHLQPSVTKNGQSDMLPLADDLLTALRMRLRSPEDEDQVAKNVPVLRTWKRDLQHARDAWINEAGGEAEKQIRIASDFLVYITDAGHADPKCVRQTLASHMTQADCDMTIVQLMLRHTPQGGMKLTTGPYGDKSALLNRKRAAIQRTLTWYSEQRAEAAKQMKAKTA